MLEAPLLSICIPAYNRPNWLQRGLESITVGEGSDIEIVITDDSDTDQGQAIATWFMVDIKIWDNIPRP
jgi:glycosyltransferase involved in cell wall biosynthesis